MVINQTHVRCQINAVQIIKITRFLALGIVGVCLYFILFFIFFFAFSFEWGNHLDCVTLYYFPSWEFIKNPLWNGVTISLRHAKLFPCMGVRLELIH